MDTTYSNNPLTGKISSAPMSRLTIYQHDMFLARKNERYPATQCGIIRVDTGTLSYMTRDNQPRRLHQGEFTLYHSNQFKSPESTPNNGTFSAEVITFEPSLFRQFFDQLKGPSNQLIKAAQGLYKLNPEFHSANNILALLSDLKKAGTSAESTLESLAFALLSEMLHISPSMKSVVQAACFQTDIEKIIGFIEINIDRDVSLSNTAHFLDMSIATLKRRLASENLSFSQILKMKRVNHAATQLRLTQKSIAQIAIESGFKSPAHFSTAFKSVLAMTPKAFREKIVMS